MSFVVAIYSGVACAACGQSFDRLGDFKGHDADGEPCPGGRVG